MKFVDQTTYYLLIGFSIGIVNWFIAGWKSRDKLCWFLLGVFFNLLSLLILFFLPSLQYDPYSETVYSEDRILKQQRNEKIKQRCLYVLSFLISIFLLYILFSLLIRFIG